MARPIPKHHLDAIYSRRVQADLVVLERRVCAARSDNDDYAADIAPTIGAVTGVIMFAVGVFLAMLLATGGAL